MSSRQGRTVETKVSEVNERADVEVARRVVKATRAPSVDFIFYVLECDACFVKDEIVKASVKG